MRSELIKTWIGCLMVWVIILLAEYTGLRSFCVLIEKLSNHASGDSIFYQLYLIFSPVFALAVLICTPVWISHSTLTIRMAVEKARENDIESVRRILFSRTWKLFPRPKYCEIILILKALCDRKKGGSSNGNFEFSEHIRVKSDGALVVSREGFEQMEQKLNHGWLNAKMAEELKSPKSIKMLLKIIIIVGIIKAILMALNLLIKH